MQKHESVCLIIEHMTSLVC